MRDEDGYTGPATLVVGDREFGVDVDLRGYFQPIDGLYHWYGRVSAHSGLDEFLRGKKHTVVVRTDEGEASGELADPDMWRRYRLLGVSTPPFEIPKDLADVEG